MLLFKYCSNCVLEKLDFLGTILEIMPILNYQTRNKGSYVLGRNKNFTMGESILIAFL